MFTIALGHLFLDVTINPRCGQWRMLVSNNGVSITSTYGRLQDGKAPSTDELQWRAAFAVGPNGRNLPQNVWS